MKTIRYLAASLLLLTGILHLILEIKTPEDPNALATLAFGIVYLLVGILLFTRSKWGPILGFLIPLIGLAMGFIVVGVQNWNTFLRILFSIDVIVIILCLILLLSKKR